MKYFICTIVIAILFVSNNLYAACQDESDLSVSYACFEKEYKEVDAEMSNVYRTLISAMPTDKEDMAEQKAFVSKLKEAQRAWLKYRDAHVGKVTWGHMGSNMGSNLYS